METLISAHDRQILQDHVQMVRELEQELKTELALSQSSVGHAVPVLPPNIEEQNDNMPLNN